MLVDSYLCAFGRSLSLRETALNLFPEKRRVDLIFKDVENERKTLAGGDEETRQGWILRAAVMGREVLD